ncbi:unnamed protein product [Penicillium bialowiezense]
MPIHGFVYTRAILTILGVIQKSSPLKDSMTWKVSYAEAVICAGCISVGHCSKPWAVFLYLGVFAVIGVLDQWTSQTNKKPVHPPSAVAQSLHATGLIPHTASDLKDCK